MVWKARISGNTSVHYVRRTLIIPLAVDFRPSGIFIIHRDALTFHDAEERTFRKASRLREGSVSGELEGELLIKAISLSEHEKLLRESRPVSEGESNCRYIVRVVYMPRTKSRVTQCSKF